MADFKIKPAAGTGNKLILESEDGTDVLTTSDSGVTLASATLVTPDIGTPSAGVATNLTGIPAAQVSGVLPAGVTGGSGLNAIPVGTVSSSVTPTTDGLYTRHTFTSDGTFTVTGNPVVVEYLVVAGGGGGGGNEGGQDETGGAGGGGGGGVLHGKGLVIGAGICDIVVGAGGVGGAVGCVGGLC